MGNVMVAERTVLTPTAEELKEAHVEFERMEVRNIFYRAAMELVESALMGRSSLSLGEAIAVLLQTWNQSFYRFRPFNEEHLSKLEVLLNSFHEPLTNYRQQDITRLTEQDEIPVKGIFAAFEELLYPVGTAKCLHLLAPRFFPLWDRAIAEGYGLPLGKKGHNEEKYWHFMQITKEQVRQLGENLTGCNMLKALDEYNYCVYTKHLLLTGLTQKKRNQ